jgi:hypothetical protein
LMGFLDQMWSQVTFALFHLLWAALPAARVYVLIQLASGKEDMISAKDM